MATNNGVNAHTAADLLRQAMMQKYVPLIPSEEIYQLGFGGSS